MSKIKEFSAGENYNVVNADWTGVRKMRQNEELVQYSENSSNRIWLNEQTEDYPTHWHAAMEIIMPVENYYDVDAAGEHYHILPSNILIIPPREPHALHAPSEGRRFIFLMNVSAVTHLKGYTSLQTMIGAPLLMTPENSPFIFDDVYQILVRIRNAYYKNAAYSEFTILSLLLELFARLMESHDNASELFLGVSPVKQQEYVQRFSRVLEYINGHYTEELTQDGLAEYAGLSKSHFSRLFKQYTGFTLGDYLHRRRIKAAEELLEDPSNSITEAAMNAGFSSIPTFNRLFREFHGCSPREYRTLHASAVQVTPHTMATGPL